MILSAATSPIHFETGSATHAGRVRAVNEDNLLATGSMGVWLVADGMGGHSNGHLASSMIVDAVKTLGRSASAPDLMARFKDRIYRVNAELIRLNGGDDVIGSTLAALLVFGDQFACIWAGDSRCYLIRSPVISQLSHDHSEVQELVDRGVINSSEAKTWPRRNVVTRAIGVYDDLELDAVQGRIHDRDIFVLCSDGLTGHVDDDEIRRYAERAPPQAACDQLIQLTLERGASDNVTVVIVRCLADRGVRTRHSWEL
jgi:protein phosphatase